MAEDREIGFQDDFAFQTPSPGWHRLRIDAAELNEVEKGTEAVANLSIVGGKDSGITLFDRYPFHAQRDFGYRKFNCVLCVTGILEKAKKRTVSWFDKNMEKLVNKLEGREFAGEISITKGDKGTFSNVTKYMSVEEAKKKGVFKAKPKASEEEKIEEGEEELAEEEKGEEEFED